MYRQPSWRAFRIQIRPNRAGGGSALPDRKGMRTEWRVDESMLKFLVRRRGNRRADCGFWPAAGAETLRMWGPEQITEPLVADFGMPSTIRTMRCKRPSEDPVILTNSGIGRIAVVKMPNRSVFVRHFTPTALSLSKMNFSTSVFGENCQVWPSPHGRRKICPRSRIPLPADDGPFHF